MSKNKVSPAVQRAHDLRRDPDRYFRDARERAERAIEAERGDRSRGSSAEDSEAEAG